MANRKTNGKDYKGIIVDTAPGAGGYWTDPVSGKGEKGAMYLMISGIFSATAVLQFQDVHGTWTNWADEALGVTSFTDTTKQVIEDHSDTLWRAGVPSGGFISGAVRITINYANKNIR
jgi:hypothetical protein